MLSNLVAKQCAVPRLQKPFRCSAKVAPSKLRVSHTVKVAIQDEYEYEEEAPEGVALVPLSSKFDVTEEEGKELELDDLDAAQERLLHWALFNDDHEGDLDEMIDYEKLGDEEYEELLEDLDELYDEAAQEIHVGDKVMGTVYEIDDDGAYVEIGQKASGFVPLSECAFTNTKLSTPLEVLRVGMQREFMVVEDADDFGRSILSLAAQEAGIFWQRLKQLLEEEITVLCKVESANKGGLLVTYGGLEGFVPVSQFGPSITPETMEGLVGSMLPVKFMEVNEENEKLVMSNKKVGGSGMSSDMGAGDLRLGDIVTGVVQSVKQYGAFIDIGTGTAGLLHVSQISHERVTNVEKVLSEGDIIKAMILSLDRERNRVTLTTKKLEATPGDMINNPQLVFEKAEEMALMFKSRVEAAESSLDFEQSSQYQSNQYQPDLFGYPQQQAPDRFSQLGQTDQYSV